MKRTLVFHLLCWLVWHATGESAVIDRTCKQHFRKQMYAQAGACFERGVPTKFAKLSQLQQVVLGRRLRNAALSYHRALQQEPHHGKQAYYCERAVRLLRLYLQHRLFESTHRKTSAIVMLHELQEKLYYVPLTVLTQREDARIKVRGFHFQAQAKGRWSGNLRAGEYHISVVYKGQTSPVQKTVSIVSRQPMVISLVPPAMPLRPMPPPKRSISPAAWILLGAGGAILLAAGLTLGFRALSEQEAREVHARALQSNDPQLTAQVEALEQRTNQIAIASIVCWSVGGAAILSGVLLLFVPVTTPQGPKALKQTPQPSPVGVVSSRIF